VFFDVCICTYPWQASLSSLGGYRKLISRFYGFYAPLECVLEDHAGEAVELHFSARRKTRVLHADLRALGVMTPDLSAIERCKALPRIETVAHVVGCLYVLEEATLGGRVIASGLEKQLGITAANGGAFFASYADYVDTMWLSLNRAAESCCDTAESQDHALDAAVATFECFIKWFRSERLYPVPTGALLDFGLVTAVSPEGGTRCLYFVAGSVNVNAAPLPTRASAVMVPPWRSMMR
jgi:heme oxygenase (biliverdin-IX-beta and delta-forming)